MLPERKHVPNQTYAQEQREHWGSKAEATVSKASKAPAHVGSEKRGTELIKQQEGAGHDNQPQGKSVGAGSAGGAEHHKGSSFGGSPHTFPGSSGSHSFGHAAHVRSGSLRMSGNPGAHRLGKR